MIQLQVCVLECGGDDDESALWQRRLEEDVLRLDVVGRHLRALEGYFSFETCHNGTSALRKMEAGPKRFVLITWKLDITAYFIHLYPVEPVPPVLLDAHDVEADDGQLLLLTQLPHVRLRELSDEYTRSYFPQ